MNDISLEKKDKYCLFPLENMTFWNLYKKQLKAIWTVEELDFSEDYKDYMTLDENKKHTIKMILGFFANSDGLVNFNIKNNFLNDFSNEITYTYIFQMFMENIHNETYSIMIETLIKDEKEKAQIFDSLNTNESIKEISKWGLEYSNGKFPISIKILVFICFEGIMFSGAFAIIYWLKKYAPRSDKSFMVGLIKSNELISRDEGMHVEFGIELFKFNNTKDNIPNYKITEIILQCVNLTKKFNKDTLNVKHMGINEELMNQYTEYVADRIFVELGLDKFYKTNNPFSFMNTIGMVQKTNFHESRPTEYQKASSSSNSLNIDDDF